MDPNAAEMHTPTSRGPCRFELARAEDEAMLRELLRNTPLGGSVRTTLRREPNYFTGAATEGPFHQVLVAREESSGEVVGMATRSVRERYVDGRPTAVGYLGGLRLLPRVRNGWVLARGFRALRELHADGRADFYLTTITEGNSRAMESLLGGRAGLPHYHELGRYFTFVLGARGHRTTPPLPEFTVGPLSVLQLPQFLAFLAQSGKDRLFFPCLSDRDFQAPCGTYLQLPLDRIVCAWSGGRIVGTLARWDQSGFKQTYVEGYEGTWNWGRHPYNAVAHLRGWPKFPAPGQRLRQQMLALPVIPSGDVNIFQALLSAVRALPEVSQCDCLLLGAFEQDRLVPWALRESLHCYVSRLFAVCWDPERVEPQRFRGRDVYLELGCL